MADNELDVGRLPRPDIRPAALATHANLQVAGSSDTVRVTVRPEARRRDLDWNVVAVPPNGEIGTPTGAGVDVLIHVLVGSGRLTTEEGTIKLTPGALLWLPSRSRPKFTAGPDGLRYLTVNQKWKILPP